MNLDEIPLFSMLRGRMSYLAERQRVIAENVANADTPGYKPRDMKPFSFESQLGGGQGGGFGGGPGMLAPTQSQSGHMSIPAMPAFGSSGSGANSNTVKSADSETTLDGNGVVLEEEMMKMTEARMDYDAAVSFYQKALGLLRMAARAPGR